MAGECVIVNSKKDNTRASPRKPFKGQQTVKNAKCKHHVHMCLTTEKKVMKKSYYMYRKALQSVSILKMTMMLVDGVVDGSSPIYSRRKSVTAALIDLCI